MTRKAKPEEIEVDHEFESNTRHKLAPISYSYRVQFMRDCDKFLERLKVITARAKERHRLMPTHHSAEQLKHWKSLRAGVRWLLKINEQRRGLNGSR